MSERMGRRKALGRIAAMTAVGSLAPLVAIACASQTPPDGRPLVEGLTASLPIVDLRRLFTEGRNFDDVISQSAETFMGLPTPQQGFKNDRTVHEVQLFKFLEEQQASAADILHALSASGTIDGRAWGMNLLWQKRQAGQLKDYGVLPLDNGRIKWALDNGIDPRLLAIARETTVPAVELLKVAPDLFFEGLPSEKREQVVVENTVPNAGAFTKLMMTETGHVSESSTDPLNRFWGNVFIGGGRAWTQINPRPDLFPSGYDDLVYIATALQGTTKLPYLAHVEMLPGSERGNLSLNASGGAIGPQFMPINARLFMDWYNEANRRLGEKYPFPNPFDPYTGSILAYLYLAATWYMRHGQVNRRTDYILPGYLSSNDPDGDALRIQAFLKWNPTDQGRTALDAGYSYNKLFGRK